MIFFSREIRRRVSRNALFLIILLLTFAIAASAIESGLYRILSVSDSIKVILVSQIPNKTKYILEAGAAKITVNGKPAEFKDLKFFAMAQVKFELRKQSKEGIEIDGVATEIKISAPAPPK